MSPSVFLRGLKAVDRRCTRCGSDDVRPSRRQTPRLARPLGLHVWRCRACWQLYLLPERVTEPTAAATSNDAAPPAGF